MRVKRWLLLLAAVAALSGGIFSYHLAGLDKAATYPQLHSFSLPDTEGKTHNIDEWKGKVLVINFWASWCSPCRQEIPLFMQLQESHRNQGLQFIGIAIEDIDPVREYTKTLQINYPNLVAGISGLGLSIAFGNLAGGVPFSVVVNRKGRIVYSQPGIFDLEAFQETVVPLL